MVSEMGLLKTTTASFCLKGTPLQWMRDGSGASWLKGNRHVDTSGRLIRSHVLRPAAGDPVACRAAGACAQHAQRQAEAFKAKCMEVRRTGETRCAMTVIAKHPQQMEKFLQRELELVGFSSGQNCVGQRAQPD